MTNDLPAIYHEHDDLPTEHTHKGSGPGHYIGPHGHYHLTELWTADEIAEQLGVGKKKPDLTV